MNCKRSRWWLSLALAATTACPIYAASQPSHASLPSRGCFFHDSELDLPPFAHPLPEVSQDDRMDWVQFQDEITYGWDLAAKAMQDASSHLLSTFQNVKEMASGISLQSVLANLREDSKSFSEERNSLEPLGNPESLSVARPELGMPPSPELVASLDTWGWDHADFVECDVDRFGSTQKPILAHDDYARQMIDQEYSDYDLSVREQLWLKGTVPGREPTRLPIFGDGRSEEMAIDTVSEASLSGAELAELNSNVDEDDCWRAFQREEASHFIELAQLVWQKAEKPDLLAIFISSNDQIANRIQDANRRIVESLPHHVRKPIAWPDVLDAYSSSYELAIGQYIVVPRSFSFKSEPSTAEVNAPISTTSDSRKFVSLRTMKATATRSIAGGLKAIGGWFHQLADQLSSISDAEIASLEGERR